MLRTLSQSNHRAPAGFDRLCFWLRGRIAPRLRWHWRLVARGHRV